MVLIFFLAELYQIDQMLLYISYHHHVEIFPKELNPVDSNRVLTKDYVSIEH